MLADAVLRRIETYKCTSPQEFESALLEIIQEITLLGLWRAKFFDKAAFYGGTALRILYGLDRFSEDLDFSLLEKEPSFSLETFNHSVIRELHSLGFDVTVEEKKKTFDSQVRSAFIKANTKEHFLRIGLSDADQNLIQSNKILKIKFEIDVDPPLQFDVEQIPMSFPGPFSVKTMILSDLFAGKMHALLFRDYKGWVKGRDWYDFLWFLGKKVQINRIHLQERMRESGQLDVTQELTENNIRTLLKKRVENLDIDSAKTDIRRFLKDSWKIDHWSTDYFLEVSQQLKIM